MEEKKQPRIDDESTKITKPDADPKPESSYVKGPSSTDTRGASGESGGLRKTPSDTNP